MRFKFFLAISLVAIAMLASCVPSPEEGVQPNTPTVTVTQTPTNTPVPATPTLTNTPQPTATVPPTATALPTTVPSATTQPTRQAAAAPVTGGTCGKHGTVAWQNDNQLSGALYGESPIGGLDEPCGVVGQTWTSAGGTERFVFYVPPFSVVWLSGHRGGTGWYFDPSQDVNGDLQKQVNELRQRDGEMKTTVAQLPGQTFRLVTRFRGNNAVAPTQQAVQTPSTSAPGTPAATSAGKCDGTATGPAIVEKGPPATLAKVNTGNTESIGQGGCYSFDSQSALDARWPGHKAEFLRKFPGAIVKE